MGGISKETYVAFVRETRRWLGHPGERLVGSRLPNKPQRQKAKKMETESAGSGGGKMGRESERKMKTDAMLAYIRGYQAGESGWSNEITLARYSPTRFGTGL